MQKLIFFIGLSILPLLGFAQAHQTVYGKNRVQQENFKWKQLSFRNFNVLYYGENLQLAEYTGKFAEENLFNLTQILGFTPPSKINLIIYSSIEDYQQSNIGIYSSELISGAQPTFVKSRVEIPFTGTIKELEAEIIYGIVNTMLNTLLYGGSLKDVLQNSYFLTIPKWYLPGISRYASTGWSIEMDNLVRSLALHGQLREPDDYHSELSILLGQSLWNYFFITYGEKEFQSLINHLRILKHYRTAFSSSTGISYSHLIEDWKAFYSQPANELKNEYTLPDDSISKISTGKKIPSVSINGNGQIAFSAISNQGYELFIFNDKKEKFTKVKKKGNRLFGREGNKKLPLIKWIDNNKLAYINPDKTNLSLTIINSKGKVLSKRPIPTLDAINGFDISRDQKFLLIAGSVNGQTDLYIFSLKDNHLRQITNNQYDEISPIFLNDQNTIAYSAIELKKETGSQYVVYYGKINDTKNHKAIDITGNSLNPVYSGKRLFFINDKTGIQNIYSFDIDSSVVSPITSYLVNVSDFDMANDQIVFQSLSGSRNSIYLTAIPGSGSLKSFDKLTNREKYLLNLPENANDPDSIPEDKLIDINNYRFESELLKERKNEEGFFQGNRTEVESGLDKVFFIGPYKYRNKLSFEMVRTSPMVDPFRGLGLMIEAGFTDLLENHKLYAGIFTLTDLKTSNLFGEYQYLKQRIDLGFRIERKTLDDITELTQGRYAINKLDLNIKYPIDLTKRYTFTPFIASVNYTPLYVGFFLPDSTNFYTGVQQSFVIDNTISTGLNTRKGLQSSISLQNYFSANSNKSFSKLFIDTRLFVPLYKRITLATRLSLGKFFGNAPKDFLLGGVDNPFFYRTNIRRETSDPLYPRRFENNSHLLFIHYATPLRGFDYNAQYGNNFGLFNAELRIPLTGLVYSEDTKLSFFRNLQLIGFYDFGTAWSGKTPFSNENTLNTQVVAPANTPFSAVVTNYKKPYLYGYGIGVRTLLLGFFVKLDVAWGVQDDIIQNRKYYLTFGYDF